MNFIKKNKLLRRKSKKWKTGNQQKRQRKDKEKTRQRQRSIMAQNSIRSLERIGILKDVCLQTESKKNN